MASAEKTLRLIFPDWQHGANPGSGFVPRFLASIAPQGEHSETVEITPGDVSPERTQNEVVAARALTILSPEDFKVCYNAAREVLDAKAPRPIPGKETTKVASFFFVFVYDNSIKTRA